VHSNLASSLRGGGIAILHARKCQIFHKIPQTERVVPKTVSGVLPGYFLFHQAILLNFPKSPDRHVYLARHMYLALKSTLFELKAKKF